MKEGTNIALITDAGTPGISDPGEELVKQCYEAGIELTSLLDRRHALQRSRSPEWRRDEFAFEAFLRRIRRKSREFWKN